MRYWAAILCISPLSLHAVDYQSTLAAEIRETPYEVITLRSFIYTSVTPENASLCADKLGALHCYGSIELFSPYYTALYYAYRLHLNPPVNAEMSKLLALNGKPYVHLHNLTGELMRYQQYLWWDDLVQLKHKMDAGKNDAAEQYLDMIGKRIDDLQKQFCDIKKQAQWLQRSNNIWNSITHVSPDVDCEEAPACLHQEIKKMAYAMENVPYLHETVADQKEIESNL